jgi:hypothetical protein
MPAGLSADMTKRTVDQTCGAAAQALNVAFRNVGSAKDFLDVLQDTELEALGYTPEDTATIRSAMADLDQLREVYEGLIDAPQKDYRQFAQRIWGTGFTGQ